MSIYINNPAAEELARELAARERKTITQIVLESLEEKAGRTPLKLTAQEKKRRRKNLREFVKNRPKLRYKDGRSLKEITDDLWGQ